MDVQVEDISEQTAALALQGPASAKLLKTVAEADIANLKYFRKTSGKIAGVPVDISRTGYTGDLGYEIWIPWNEAVKVWDALMDKGRQFDIHAAGMLALDVSRVEAGLLLIEVDYTSSKKALIPSQKYSPYELGFGKMVHLDKENFIGKRALAKDNKMASRGSWSASKWIGWKWKSSSTSSDSPRQRPARLRALRCPFMRERST